MPENNQEKFEIRDLREKSKFIVDDKFLNGYARFLDVYAVGVYNSLCRHANKEQKCWPSIRKITQELDIGRNKAIDSIKYLEFWQIIKKQRIGKQATNRYLLRDKKQWKPLNELNLRAFSVVYSKDFKGLQNKLQEFTKSTSIERKHKRKETQKKGSFSFKKKLFYRGNPMRESPKGSGSWYVIENGEWLKFADSWDKVEWKI